MAFQFLPLQTSDYPLALEMKRQTYQDNGGATPPDIIVRNGIRYSFDDYFSSLFHFYQCRDAASVALLWQSPDHARQAIGMVAINVETGHINNLYLRDNNRGLGLGRMMEAYACTLLRRHGHTVATLGTAIGSSAIGFYEHLGWRIVGPHPHKPDELWALEKDL
ncbi:MAG: GNAT family N-acetyltransferase [Pseudomonadaceae bacterium]|nr:GNAT family N-acetyltransferase [Pseudomonadaceae bacterium]